MYEKNKNKRKKIKWKNITKKNFTQKWNPQSIPQIHNNFGKICHNSESSY